MASVPTTTLGNHIVNYSIGDRVTLKSIDDIWNLDKSKYTWLIQGSGHTYTITSIDEVMDGLITLEGPYLIYITQEDLYKVISQIEHIVSQASGPFVWVDDPDDDDDVVESVLDKEIEELGQKEQKKEIETTELSPEQIAEYLRLIRDKVASTRTRHPLYPEKD